MRRGPCHGVWSGVVRVSSKCTRNICHACMSEGPQGRQVKKKVKREEKRGHGRVSILLRPKGNHLSWYDSTLNINICTPIAQAHPISALLAQSHVSYCSCSLTSTRTAKLLHFCSLGCILRRITIARVCPANSLLMLQCKCVTSSSRRLCAGR